MRPTLTWQLKLFTLAVIACTVAAQEGCERNCNCWKWLDQPFIPFVHGMRRECRPNFYMKPTGCTLCPCFLTDDNYVDPVLSFTGSLETRRCELEPSPSCNMQGDCTMRGQSGSDTSQQLQHPLRRYCQDRDILFSTGALSADQKLDPGCPCDGAALGEVAGGCESYRLRASMTETCSNDTFPWDTSFYASSCEKPRFCDANTSAFWTFIGALVYGATLVAVAWVVWLLTGAEEHQRASDVAETVDVVKDVQSAASGAHAMSQQFKNVWTHIQVCAAALQCDWNWTDLLVAVRTFLGIAQLEAVQTVPLSCFVRRSRSDDRYEVHTKISHEEEDATVGPEYEEDVTVSPEFDIVGGDEGDRTARMWLASLSLMWLIGLGILRKVSSPELKAHTTNFLWASYTLMSPFVWNGLIELALAEGDPSTKWFTGPVNCSTPCFVLHVIPFIVMAVIIPGLACLNMSKANAAGTLNSPEVQASYGWLCKTYIPSCYWWELVTLVGRYLVMWSVMLGENASLAVYLIVITGMLALQVTFKPFLEGAEQASHWSSPNKQAAVGSASSLTFILVGLLLQTFEADPESTGAYMLSTIGLVAVLLPVGMTLLIVAQNKGWISGSPSARQESEYASPTDESSSTISSDDNPLRASDETR